MTSIKKWKTFICKHSKYLTIHDNLNPSITFVSKIYRALFKLKQIAKVKVKARNTIIMIDMVTRSQPTSFPPPHRPISSGIYNECKCNKKAPPRRSRKLFARQFNLLIQPRSLENRRNQTKQKATNNTNKYIRK